MPLSSNFHLIIVDDHPHLRESVLFSAAKNLNTPNISSQQQIVSASDHNSTEALQEVNLSELADLLVSYLACESLSPATLSTFKKYISTGSPLKVADAYSNVLLLIHLNMKMLDRVSRLGYYGLELYEAVVSRLKNVDVPGSEVLLPPVAFYTIEKCRDWNTCLPKTAAECWQRMKQVVEGHGLDAGHLFWDLTPQQKDKPNLEEALKIWQNAHASQDIVSTYAANVSAAAVERMNAETRHMFSDQRRPSVRILLGATQSGDVSWREAQQVLEALCNSEPEEHKTKATFAVTNYRIDVLQNYLYFHKIKNPVNPFADASFRYLLIDDQLQDTIYRWDRNAVKLEVGAVKKELFLDVNDGGWGAALSCITRGEVFCLKSPASLDDRVNIEGEKKNSQQLDWDAVFLDYDFGSANNGGYYLRIIKNRQFDLPVVMFTGFDDSSIAKWCLSHGADAYFVKEGVESEGRNSLYAYKNLRDTIISLPLFSKRDLWQRFVDIELRLEEIEETVWKQSYASTSLTSLGDPPSITWNLRQAFYWFFLSHRESLIAVQAQQSGHKSSRIKKTRVIECAASVSVYSQTALEHLIGSIGILRRGKKETLKVWSDYLRKNNILGIYGAAIAAGLTVNNSDLNRIKLREKDSHLAEPQLQDAIKCLASVLSICENMLGNSFVKTLYQNRLSRKDRLESLHGPQQFGRKSKKARNHAETAELGAKEIVEGWADLMCPAHKNEVSQAWSRSPVHALDYISNLLISPVDVLSAQGLKWYKSFYNVYNLLLIDDDYPSTGWDVALKILCGPQSVTAWTLIDLAGKKYQDLDAFDLALLDLRMPRFGETISFPEVGVETLSLLRDEHRAVPVIMLTASDEAYWTYRALREGAANYFLKRYDEANKSKTTFQLLTILLELSMRLGRNSPSRKLWRDIVNIMTLTPPVTVNAIAINKHIPELRKSKKRGGHLTSLLNQVVGKRLERVYDSYLQTLSNKFDINRIIDADRWLLEGLAPPRYRSMLPSGQLYSLPLALRCGQLVELLAKLTMTVEFPTDPPAKSAYDVISANIYQRSKAGLTESFKQTANLIWNERSPAAHGFLWGGSSLPKAKAIPMALAATDPALAAERAVSCAKEWLLWLGWQ